MFLKNWMSYITDESVSINRLAIPGTHDSCALHDTLEPFIDPTDTAKTQNWSIRTQLDNGIRAIDVRGRHMKNKLPIYHGFVDQKIDFQDVINQCRDFLNQNSKEFILMFLKDEDNASDCSRSYESTVRSYIDANPNVNWYCENRIPSIGEVRGKIILVRRFDADCAHDIDSTLGINFNGSDKNTPDTQYKNYTNTVYDQDKYEVDNDAWEWKWDRIRDCFIKAKEKNNVLYVNFASGYYKKMFGIPAIKELSDKINDKLNRFYESSPKGQNDWGIGWDWGCILLLDYVDTAMKTVHGMIFQSLCKYGQYPGKFVYIKHAAKNVYLYAAKDNWAYDGSRRKLFTWMLGGAPDNQCVWLQIPAENPNEFYFYNWLYKEYMYAAGSKFADDRRNVFGWRPGNVEYQQGIWQLIPDNKYQGAYLLKTTYKNEYLYLSEYKPQDKDRYNVCTWIPGNVVSNTEWYIGL